jgi:predicted amidohydrolase YtcJ
MTDRISNHEKADLVFTNGIVYTVDKQRSRAEALAVLGKEIVFVGNAEGVKDRIGPQTEIIDLAGKMVLPGFIDSHAHASATINENDGAMLYGLETKEDYVSAVRDFAEKHRDLSVIYGHGWNNEAFPPQGPVKEDLDAVVDDRPVSLMSHDGHSIWVNSRALDMAGVTKDTPCPFGGMIEADPATGEPSGTIRETARDLVQNVLPPYSVEQMKTGIREFMVEAARVGITTVHDPLLLLPDSDGMLNGYGAARNSISAYEELLDSAEMTIRVRGTILTDPTKGASQVPDLAAACAEQKHPLFQITGAKVFVDGVVEGGTAYLLEPYDHKPDFLGEPHWEQDPLNALFKAVDGQGLQIHIHSIGDAAIRMSLDALAYAKDHNGSRDSRHLITHLQVVDDADIPRFAELGIIGVPQPFWHVKGEYFWGLEAKYLGRERAEKEYPMKSFMDAGVTLACASDYPVQVPSPPLLAIQLGVTRCIPGETNPDEILGPEERMSLADMISAFTINGAFANFVENETGSIEVGKKADMVVLERNLFDIPPLEIAGTQLLMTVFEGKVVYRFDANSSG